jgi:hypothetical protein
MALRRGSFWFKLALIAVAVAVADRATWQTFEVGANIGLVALTWVVALALGAPAVRRDPLGRTALAAATFLALLQFERPTFVGLVLYALAMGVAALAPRAPRGEDAWRWAQRLVVGAVVPVAGPFLDLARLRRARTRAKGVRIVAVATAVALPVVGGAVFLSLFAAANPLIADFLGGWEPMGLDVGRLVVWAIFAFPLWVVLRPRGLRRPWKTPGLDRDFGGKSFAGPASIAASLALFNLIFAVQNGLDIAYLWSGAGLPDGMSFSAYAHGGAEPLIATALLAGLFVLVFLRPGSATAASRPIRILVSLWVAQNLFLVASTALRTIDYVEAYSLTDMRIAALLWMALVAVGLALILWRLLRGKSSSWLLNANVAAAAIVLAVCSVVDLSAISAAWNIRHAREVGGKGVALDLCYMRGLRGAAVVSLAELERRPIPEDLRRRSEVVRQDITIDLELNADAWRSWNWRDTRRLARLRAMGAKTVALREGRSAYQCDGSPIPVTAPPAPAVPQAPPLTPSANPRT